MLSAFGSILARAKRHTHAVPVFGCVLPQIAEGVLAGQRTQKTDIALMIDEKYTSSGSFLSLLQAVLQLAEESPRDVAVLARVHPESETIPDLLRLPISGLVLDHAQLSRKSYTTLLCQLGLKAAHEKVSCYGELTGLITANRLTDFIEETGIDGLFFDLGFMQSNEPIISLSYVKDAAKLAGVPLIGQPIPLSHAMRHRCIEAGVRGFVFGIELEEAYTAGLRTGLRNREATQPAHFEHYGLQAVSQAAHSLVTSINNN